MLLKRLLGRVAAILIVCLFGTNVSFAGTPPTMTSVLAGWVFIDSNNDGELTFAPDPNAEFMIGGVTISLYSQENGTETFITSDITDEFGRFEFEGLGDGTYGLKQTQPIQYVDGKQNLGEMFSRTGGPPPAGAFAGTINEIENEFNGIDLPPGSHGDYFLFGELGLASGFVSKRFLSGYPPVMDFGTDEPGFLIPEPATMWLAAGAVGMGLVPRRRRKPVTC
jgi:hypothetical protein